jgi:transcriptional regulator with XRE-family HTH domain
MAKRAASNPCFVFNNISAQLPNESEQRLYARDAAMLAATAAVVRRLEEQGISRAQVAERIGRTKGFVSQVLSGARNMTLATLADLLWAAGYEVRDIESRPLGEMSVSLDLMNEWLDTESEVLAAQSLGSSEKSFSLALEEDDQTSRLVAA